MTDFYPNSPTLSAVNIITSKKLKMESNEETRTLKSIAVEYVAIVQLDKRDRDGQTINH